MSIKIGSNIPSLGAQRMLGQTGSALSKTFERLSSGQRINRASDDAAGLSVSSKLNTDRRVYAQGIRNLNDGLSALSIADAALENLSSIVTRLQELAAQSANGVYSNTQRKSLDAEAQALSKEYFRISKSVKFNGLNLFDGSVDKLRLQGGYGIDGSVASGVGGAIGTGSFEARTSFATGNKPRSVTLGDLNGDGVLDMVTADTNANQISVFLGNGDGTFDARTTFRTVTYPYSISLSDLNRDGIMDLALSVYDNNGNSYVEILLGNGDGSFSRGASYPCSWNPEEIAFGDLDGDGLLDMIATAFYGPGTAFFKGNGDGTFEPVQLNWASIQARDIAVADFNSDDILDVVLVGTGTWVALGNGDGTLKAPSHLLSGSGTDVVVQDLNNDGLLDFVVAHPYGNEVELHLGNGDGTFLRNGTFATAGRCFTLSVGDLNGDGEYDIVTADYNTNTASVLLGNGDGTFGGTTTYALGNKPRSIALGDLNGDGALDVAAADLDANTVSVLLATTTDGVSPLLPFDLTTMADARQALPVFQQKLAQLGAQRGQIGAFQSRLGVAVSVLGSSVENMAAASSRIVDTDVAEESANLIRTQILQQAGAAVLTQANQQMALALKLLQDDVPKPVPRSKLVNT